MSEPLPEILANTAATPLLFSVRSLAGEPGTHRGRTLVYSSACCIALWVGHAEPVAAICTGSARHRTLIRVHAGRWLWEPFEPRRRTRYVSRSHAGVHRCALCCVVSGACRAYRIAAICTGSARHRTLQHTVRAHGSCRTHV